MAKDFRVYNRLLTLLKGMNEPFISLRPEDNFTGFDVVFTDMELRGRNVFQTKGVDEFRLKQLVRSKNSGKIVVGIDPGPTPGVATLANNVVIDKRSIYDVGEIRDYVFKVRRECEYSSFLIKVGNGVSISPVAFGADPQGCFSRRGEGWIWGRPCSGVMVMASAGDSGNRSVPKES